MDIRAFNESVIEEFRQNGGVVGGMLAGTPLLLLTTTGVRTGFARTTPISYVEDASPDRLVVFASNRGAARHPDWFRNLWATSDVEVEVGSRAFPARADVVGDDDRQRLYELFTSQNPGTEKHKDQTARRIPLVLLQPR